MIGWSWGSSSLELVGMMGSHDASEPEMVDWLLEPSG